MRHALAALLILSPAATLAQDAETAVCPGSVTVEGLGAVVAVPDRLSLSFGTEADADTPAAAFEEAARRTDAVLEALIEAGIAARDVATSGVNLGPVRERPNREAPPETVGWRASSTLSVTLRDLGRFGALVDAAVEAGATGLGSVQLEVSEPEEKLAEARDLAVRDALEKAAAMAESAGLAAGDVLTLAEAGVFRPQPQPFRAMAMADAAESMPLAAGEQRMEVRITATLALCPKG